MHRRANHEIVPDLQELRNTVNQVTVLSDQDIVDCTAATSRIDERLSKFEECVAIMALQNNILEKPTDLGARDFRKYRHFHI